MKRLLPLLLLTAPAGASVRFSWELEKDAVHERVEVTENAGRWTIYKSTNRLDKTKDLRLGTFKPKDPKKLNELLPELNKVMTEVTETDKVLEDHGAKGEDLSKPLQKSHDALVVVNGREFSSSTPYFQRLQELVIRALEVPREQVDGIMLDEKNENYVTIKNGKPASSEKFIPGFFCQGTETQKRCLARDQGVLFL